MAPSGKGVFWRDEEVEAMLEILQRSGKADRVMKSTHLPTRLIFHKLARQMSARGFTRSAEQCRSKFKRVKGSFFDALEAWQGIPRQSGRPAHFSSMLRLWEAAGRPSWITRRHAAVRRSQDVQPASQGTMNPGGEEGDSAAEEEPGPSGALSLPASTAAVTLEDEPVSGTQAQTSPGQHSIDDVYNRVSGMEGRIGSTISKVMERVTSIEGRLTRLGRRVSRLERRDQQRKSASTGPTTASGEHSQ